MPSRLPVAIVGAGIAGAACARTLTGAGVPVVVHEREARPGGRLASPHIDGRAVDLGGAYMTASEGAFAAVVADWTRRGVARPWTDRFHIATGERLGDAHPGPLRHAATAGSETLVADLLAGLSVLRGVAVAHVGPGPCIDGVGVAAVVLAMPDALAERLLDPALIVERNAIGGRPSDPVLALAAGFASREWDASIDGVFVNEHPVLAWLADDGRRRGDGAAVLVAHSTPAHARAHQRRPERGGADMLVATGDLLGVGPPRWQRTHLWPSARPVATHDAPFHLGDARVGVCGDAWGAPRVETAYLSGRALGLRLAELLT